MAFDRNGYMREYQRAYRQKNRAKVQAWRDDWRRRHPEQEREVQRLNKERVRQDVLAIMGSVCARCGFSDWRALQIDHINGNGKADSRTKQSMGFFRKWLLNHPVEAKEHYQLLCANCNWIKRYENDESFRSFKEPSAAYADKREQRRKPIVVAPAPKGHLYTFRGQTKTLAEWSAETGISLKALQSRISEQNWPLEQALTMPAARGLARKDRDPNAGAKTRMLTFEGETLTIGAWGERRGLKWKTIYERIAKHGWPVERALTTPGRT